MRSAVKHDAEEWTERRQAGAYYADVVFDY